MGSCGLVPAVVAELFLLLLSRTVPAIVESPKTRHHSPWAPNFISCPSPTSFDSEFITVSLATVETFANSTPIVEACSFQTDVALLLSRKLYSLSFPSLSSLPTNFRGGRDSGKVYVHQMSRKKFPAWNFLPVENYLLLDTFVYLRDWESTWIKAMDQSDHVTKLYWTWSILKIEK